MTNYASPVEDVATAIAATVRAKGWFVSTLFSTVYFSEYDEGPTFFALYCKDSTQATRLAEMMRAPTPVLPQQRNRATSEPGGCECELCAAIFIGGPTHDLCAGCAHPPTPLFDAMNLPETPAFPSLKKARGE